METKEQFENMTDEDELLGWYLWLRLDEIHPVDMEPNTLRDLVKDYKLLKRESVVELLIKEFVPTAEELALLGMEEEVKDGKPMGQEKQGI